MNLFSTLHRFTVVPSLPKELSGLQRIAYNLWWTWEPEAIRLFKRLDPELWRATRHNPLEMLGCLQQATYDSLMLDEGFMSHLAQVEERLDEYLASHTWYERHGTPRARIAYFSMEFGLHESLPIYSGGLGILAGDHLKSASDLGLPLVGVGLLYRQGYFRQHLNLEGWQQEIYPENDFYNLPLHLERDGAGEPLTLELEYPGRNVRVQVWRVQVGRLRLYLLDSNLEENTPADREITTRLYGGDQEMRIRQEILLGIGGIRALRLLGVEPNVCHMNEGHAAFLALERVRILMEERSLNFQEAMEAVRGGNVFTTHTPVEAGIDHFPPELLERYLGCYYRHLGLTREQFLTLGMQNHGRSNENFCMAVLAMKLSLHSNGVSELHGMVSRRMWADVWPDLPEEQLPLTYVTNGVHQKSWLSEEMSGLLTRYLGTRWLEQSDDSLWRKVSRIPDAELWRTHRRGTERLVDYARLSLKAQLQKLDAGAKEIDRASDVLDPEILTIGFARRFATYKRGTLLLHDKERLERILNHPERPVQIVFAGKAHPADHQGKELIRQIVQLAQQEGFRRRIIFLEDYDISVARRLVQGVDIWLNTPLRPQEASGTSGMKAAFNGGLNMSILDGWWCEGYRGNNGWAIGRGEVYDDLAYQNEVESRAIYDLLEKEIVPLFYNRGSDGVPRGWTAFMKASMQTLCPVFSTDRMVQEYARRCYLPAFENWERLNRDDLRLAVELARWKERLHGVWGGLSIVAVQAECDREVTVGQKVPISVQITPGEVPLTEIAVEVYFGVLDSRGAIMGGEVVPLDPATEPDKVGHFGGELECRFCGRHGFLLRVMPRHPELGTVYDPGLILWG
ncbi:alpha-glucan family phosphorylase [Geomonas subterranea]|uniref:Alpha-glucan family phosphorylase n=1 Tax=Geomonas subterranea TaxID=2847989 RepID=A0ABX8LG05_9BACT|nr:alpha-glucan family phosphorylase [Geomonas subterranea]QXE90281.1 alpha-glucan family phosphorylase [Geomonas subterranea]QXM07594.1 alpha-glucan family phosphorylase [Geomonas subterranea]